VDQLIEEVPAVSGPLKKYKVTRGGVETVMKLNDADAARLGVGADAAVDGSASTIQPIQAAQSETSSEGDDGTASDGAGDGGTPGSGAEAGAQQVQQAADSGGDGQTPDPQAAAADSPPAAKKTAAKRRTTSANKARTPSATKADGGS
jgi:hypothetical protein